MSKTQEDDLLPFADHVVKIIESDNPQGCETDTQMVELSQDLVNLDVNLTRASGSGDVSPPKPKSMYALLLNPIYNVNAKNPKIHYQTKVQNLLAIPATSANCERAFSSLTDIVTKKRNRLQGETTEKLTFCKHNLSLIPDYMTHKGETQTQTENTSDVDDWS